MPRLMCFWYNIARWKKCPRDLYADEKGAWDMIDRYTVDEALRTRPDYEMRKKDVGEWRRNNLIAQFKAAGLELTPDVWERLAADRRQALEDDLAWIHP